MHIKYVKSEKIAKFIINWKLLVSKYDLYFLYPPLTIVYTSPPMSEKMLKFVEIGQQNPPKRDKNSRKEDFNEILEPPAQEYVQAAVLVWVVRLSP